MQSYQLNLEFSLLHPKNIDFYNELKILKSAMLNITDADIQNMYNWDLYPNMEMVLVFEKLMKKYNVYVIENPRLQTFSMP